LDIHRWPKVGSQWMPKGTQVEVLTPGTNEKRYLGGALELTTGTIPHCVWYRKTTGLFLDLLNTLDRTHPAPLYTHLTVVVDNAKIHQAKKVQKWLAAHPRFELLYLPTYCPRANPIERAFGDVHDKCTRNHTRKQMWQLVQDVQQHLQVNGPWQYALSELYYTPRAGASSEPGGQDLDQVGRIPAGAEATDRQTAWACRFALEQLQGHTADHGQVLRRPVVANATAIVAETDIETPMEVILDPPMLADGPMEHLHLGRQAAEVVVALTLRTRGRATDALDQDH
jgi:hypothetical protein